MRCPLLIGCAAATNQQLPLGLPGAHRLGEGPGRTKAVGRGRRGGAVLRLEALLADDEAGRGQRSSCGALSLAGRTRVLYWAMRIGD